MNIDELTASYPSVNIGQVLNILPKYDTVFITNPKAGCSSIKLMLFKAHTGDYTLDPPNVHAERILPRPSSVGWDRVASMLSGGAYRFTFVRHPIKRAISAYNDKIISQRFAHAGKVQRALGRQENPNEPVSLDDFVAALEAQPVEEMDPHWRPQHINIMHSSIEYDFIGRLESFDRDIARVKADAGLPDVPLVHRNKRAKAGSEAPRDIVRRLEKVYKRDFEVFGY